MAKFTYDQQVDCGYVQLSDAPVARTAPANSSVVVDYDRDGNIVGVEVLHVQNTIAWRDSVAQIAGSGNVAVLMGFSKQTTGTSSEDDAELAIAG